MDPDRFLGFVAILVASLLGAARLCCGEFCPCGAPPVRDLTSPAPKLCFQIDSKFRYTCVEGYVRKAGTSNLIRCQKKPENITEWSSCNLQCIPDPRIKTQSPTSKAGPSDEPTQPPPTLGTSIGGCSRPAEGTHESSSHETISASPTPSGVNSSRGAQSGAEAASITVPVVLSACAAAAIGLFLLRRKRKRVPERPTEEECPMNESVP